MNQQARILALGEVLWDVFPDGPRFGGAPANFACHSAALGADVAIGSRVGDDPLGARARRFLEEHHVGTQAVQIDRQHPTGSVAVELDSAGKPSFAIRQQVAWDHLELTPSLSQLANQADAVCFGTLAQRGPVTRQTMRQLLDHAAGGAVRLLDLNLRLPFYDPEVIESSLRLADALKLNEEELAIVSEQLGVEGSELDQLKRLQARYELQLIALTRGEKGSCLMTSDEISDHPGRDVRIVDTVGAGDSFTATMMVGHLANLPLEATHRWAVDVASFVCGQAGAVPTLPDHLRSTA